MTPNNKPLKTTENRTNDNKSKLDCCYDGFTCNDHLELVEHCEREHYEDKTKWCAKHRDTNLIRVFDRKNSMIEKLVCPKCHTEEFFAGSKVFKSYPSIEAFFNDITGVSN